MSRGTSIRLAAASTDLLLVVAALSLGGMWSAQLHVVTPAWWLDSLVRIAIYAATWVFVTVRLGTYEAAANGSTAAAIRAVVEAWAVTWGIAGLLDVGTLGGIGIWQSLAAGLALFTLSRLVLLRAETIADSERTRFLVVGTCPSLQTLGLSRQPGVDLVGVVPLPGEQASALPQLRPLGTIQDLGQVVADHEVDVALVCPSDAALTGDVHRVFRFCEEAGLGVQYFPSFLDLRHLHASLTWADGRPGLSFDSGPNRSLGQLVKRMVDVVGAGLGILALTPALVACALAVKLSSRGPVFFRQVRVGKNGRHFHCFKFRTMFVGSHALQEQLRAQSIQDGPAFKIPRDPRITPVGRILRKFSLDELPQLFNVLLGDMSLVGPRPPIPAEVKNYTWWQRRRISVKPGLTCVWQVWGRNRVSFKRWVEMDLFYIDNWSVWMDLKLIVHTIRVVLAGTGM